MKKFWNWKTRKIKKIVAVQEPNGTGQINEEQEVVERTLYLDGAIADESWYDDEVTPAIFKEELNAGSGDITVWINSPGGDCVAAAQIYNMLKEYPGNVTVKIDGLAASAASVIAMAGDEVLMSPVAIMMIHNPSTIAMGDSEEMRRAIQSLDEVKESIINAYEQKTGLSRRELGKLMDSEYWMNAKEALSKGFIDEILYQTNEELAERGEMQPEAASAYSPVQIQNSLMEKIAAKCRIAKPKEAEPAPELPAGKSYSELMGRLNLLKSHI